MALAEHRLQAWPHPGKVALREHHATSGRTDIHVFDHWCHIATAHNDADLEEAVQTRKLLAFDLDTYRLLVKRLGHGSQSNSTFFHVKEPAYDT
jgi:DNA polymerase-3 subunit epsilon